MCLFITAVVPKSALSDEFMVLVKQHRLSFAPCENPHVASQLRATERYLHATATYCDCGSPLFSGGTARSQAAIDREVRKLRKKKWSEAKIARWLEAAGPRPNDPNAAPNGQRSVNEWSAFLEAALALRKVPYVALVGHWYRGDVASDAITLTGRVSHAVKDLRGGQLGILDQDVVYEFRLANDDAA